MLESCLVYYTDRQCDFTWPVLWYCKFYITPNDASTSFLFIIVVFRSAQQLQMLWYHCHLSVCGFRVDLEISEFQCGLYWCISVGSLSPLNIFDGCHAWLCCAEICRVWDPFRRVMAYRCARSGARYRWAEGVQGTACSFLSSALSLTQLSWCSRDSLSSLKHASVFPHF